MRRIMDNYVALSLNRKSVIWFTLATIIQNAILFLVTPIYTRILSDEQYGVFSVYQSWQQIISIIAILALDRSVTVGFMKYEEHRKEFLASIQGLMTVLVLGFTVIACIFHDMFEKIIDLPIHIIIAMLVVALLNSTMNNWSWLQRYKLSYKKLTAVTIFSTLIIQFSAVLAIMILPFDDKGNVMIMAMSAARLVVYGIIYVSVIKQGREVYNKNYWKFALGYSIAIVPHALAQIILNSSDRIMIDKMCGRDDAAYYGVTYSAAMVLNIIVTSISSAVQPWFFEKIKRKDFESIKSKTNILLLISACLSIGVSVLAPEVLSIMAPVSYKAALWVFPSVAAGVFFNSMYLYFANFESYYEKPYYFSVATGIGAIVNIILNFIFIPRFGFVVAGYTTLICYALFAFMHYVFMRKICRKELCGIKPFDSKFIVILSVVVVVSSIGVSILYNYSIVRLVLVVIVLLVGFLKRGLVLEVIKKIVSMKNDKK